MSSNKRASQRDALFVCLLFSFTVWSAQLAAQTCTTPPFDETVEVAKVTDGDTLRLRDGRSVRLIGINSPELAHTDKPAEPLAEQARDFF